MNKRVAKTASNAVVFASIMGLSSAAMAELGVDISGFIRQEMAYKTTSDENVWNQAGNPYNGKLVVNSLGLPVTRTDFSEKNDWNLMATRGELDFQIAISDNWSSFVKVRGFFDYDSYDNYGDANHFETPFFGDCGTRLEVCGDDYMVDLPSAYLDYNNGPLWLRFGNQQIAWGEALFFRVADVANGLDLRRHSFIDYASEEYADERIASPGVRGSYRFANNWELEGFAQMFSPTLYNNENTPYNVIGSQFVVQQKEFFNDVDNEWNVGFRLQGQVGELGLQFFAVNRRNPDGTFRWTESKVNPTGDALGELLSQTAFEIDPQGVWTSNEWFDYAGGSRLDGVKGLDSSILEFPAAQALGAFPIEGDPTGTCAALGLDERGCANYELDFFYSPAAGGLGPLRGHLAREYDRENVFGWGMNYMFFSEPDSFLDQLVTRFEMSYTPDKEFTDIGLSRNYIEEDEYAASIVLEKYQRFSQSFPATFIVFEYMFKSESDMFGRHLDGMDSDGQPDGISSFNAFAFAVQQPSPTLKWRYDLAVLYDVQGGIFIQPAVRWKPSSAFTVEAFYNYFDSNGGNDDIIETIEWSDEIGMRIGYQF
jgi:hypothetical protein